TRRRAASPQERLGAAEKNRHSASRQPRYGKASMKIVVFGAGAVGGHVATRLDAGADRAGIDVAVVARGAQLAAIRERGLILWIGEERYSARFHATDRPETLGLQDVVFVALKSSVLPEAAPALRKL